MNESTAAPPSVSRPTALAMACVRAYRVLVSPLLPPSCRFEPSCSCYAIEALACFGALHGGWLAAKRIARCHPWCSGGFDPVPAADPNSAPRQADSRSASRPSS